MVRPLSGPRALAGARTLVAGRRQRIPDSVAPPPGPGGPTAPVISGVTATSSANGTQETIAWSLDQPSQGWVQYGLTVGYGAETTRELSYLYSAHAQTVTGLTPGTTYHYRIHAVNAAAQETITADGTFLTNVGSTGTIVYTEYAGPASGTIASLQAAWDAMPDGADAATYRRLNLPPGALYTGAAGLVFTGRKYVELNGGGTPVAEGHVGGAVINSTGAWGTVASSCFRTQGTGTVGVRFVGLTALGSSPSSGIGAYATASAGKGGEIAMGWALYGGTGTVIRNCIADRCKGDGVYLAAYGSEWARDTVIADYTCKRNGRMGLGIIAADGLTVQRVFFDDICYSPIDYEPNAAGEGARGVHLFEDIRTGRYSWDNTFGEGAIAFITGSGSATFTGSLTMRRFTIGGRNMAFPTRAGSLFYLHRGAPKQWSLLLELGDGLAARGPGPYVVALGGWAGATTIQNNHNMITVPSVGGFVYDGGGNTGARSWVNND